jgi:hypothetical protein
MSGVFLSFSHADWQVAEEIVVALRRVGIQEARVTPPHLDKTFVPGTNAKDAFNRVIDGADCVIGIWSEAAAQSSFAFVRDEVQRAIQAWSTNRLVLVRLDRTELPPGLRDLEARDLVTESGSIVRTNPVADTQARLFGPSGRAVSLR